MVLAKQDSINSTDDSSRLCGHIRALRLLPLLVVAVVAVLVVAACSEEKKNVVGNVLNPEKTPTIVTRDIETLISDSGIIRYRITTPLWEMYEEAKEPFWRFPQHVHLEKFNDLGVKDAFIDCDSARYFRNEQIWRLDGHITISNLAGDKFRTNQIFWNQRDRKVYSDSFIQIERTDRIIEGYGFRSNDQMTDYTVYRVAGIFPVEGLKTNGAAAGPAPTGSYAGIPQSRTPSPQSAPTTPQESSTAPSSSTPNP